MSIALLLAPWICRPDIGQREQLDGVVDLAGKAVNPFARDAKLKANVFFFVATECPISNKYVPEIKRLMKEFEPKGVRFWFIYPEPETTVEAIRKHAADFAVGVRVLCDRKHRLVRKGRAEVTPEAALFSASGDLVYHGRIDDRFPALGVERAQATDRTLEVALTSFLAGRNLLVTETKAVGCWISVRP